MESSNRIPVHAKQDLIVSDRFSGITRLLNVFEIKFSRLEFLIT